MARKILLHHGCTMSQPSVNPKNWKSGNNSLLNKNWQIQYYFYDPQLNDKYPYGKLIKVQGMNSYKCLSERRQATKYLIEKIILENKTGYNPITKLTIPPVEYSNNLHPYIDFISAFRTIHSKLDASEVFLKNMRIAINRIEKKAIELQISNTPIKNLKRIHIKQILEGLKLSNHGYNKYRAYLSVIYNELLEYECVEYNLVRDIRKRVIERKIRETLTTDQFTLVMQFLKEHYYDFYRYAMIFMYSGSRSSELLNIKIKDIDIGNQEYNVLIKKGKQYKWKTKVILKEALPFWNELLKMADKGDYLFSNDLIPGKDKIKPYQITKRWYRLVKNANNKKGYDRKPINRLVDKDGHPVTITADFYSLKHSFLDSLPKETAQIIAAHTNSDTTRIYRINQEKRDRQVLKDLNL